MTNMLFNDNKINKRVISLPVFETDHGFDFEIQFFYILKTPLWNHRELPGYIVINYFYVYLLLFLVLIGCLITDVNYQTKFNYRR